MSFFMQSGDTFTPTPGRDSMLDALPVGNYIVIETMQGLKFQRVDSFPEPSRAYGRVNERVERILNTFEDRDRSTGVLLSGEKGSGKSMLARNISHAAYAKGIPTILVNAPFMGDGFNSLLASIEQPAIVLMDEFEKVYSDPQAQEQILTLLDGMVTSKKLFILTVNDKYRINEHMMNRPGRLYYAIDYAGLEAEFVREYCEDTLKDQAEVENVVKVSAMFRAFNFDMLKAMVEEMNRYDESAFDVIDILNAKPALTTSSSVEYKVTVTAPNGAKAEPVTQNLTPIEGGAAHFYVEFPEGPGVKVDEDGDVSISLTINELVKLDMTAGVSEFKTKTGFKVEYVKQIKGGFDIRSL